MVTGSVHHISRRKRADGKLMPYPHPSYWINFLDKIILLLALIVPLFNIPQILKIIEAKSSAGVSILSFSLFAVISVPWLIYGAVHKEKPIIAANIMWLVLNVGVIAAALIYR